MADSPPNAEKKASMRRAYVDFKEWLDAVQPRRQDVLGDFAGRELCVIHGESLLMHCLAEARVDFHGGFQLLHLIHAIETFLDKLRSRKCNFSVLWFDDHEGLLLPAQATDGEEDDELNTVPEKHYAWHTALQKRRLARAVLIRHLEWYCQQTTPAMDLSFRFTSMDSKEFAEYTKRHLVRLFFVSDGQAAFICDSIIRQSAVDTIPTGQRNIGTMTFESIIYRLSTSGYTVGLLDDVEFKSSEVRAGLYTAQPRLHFDIAMWRPVSLPKADFGAGERLLKICSDPKSNVFRTGNKELFTSRELTAAIALAIVLAEDFSAEMNQWATAFLVHLAILKHCSLQQRPSEPYSRDSLEDAKLDRSFMNRFCDASIAILTCQQSSNTDKWDTYDLVDGRIFASVLLSPPKMDPDSLVFHSLTSLLSLVYDFSGIELRSDAEELQAQTILSEATSNARQKYSHQETSLLPFSQPDFEALLKDVVVAASPNSTEPPSTFGSRLFKEDSHWHSNIKLATLPGGQSTPDVQYMLKRRNQRNQRLMARMLTNAASLTNAKGKVLDAETIIVAKPDDKQCRPKIRKAHLTTEQRRKHELRLGDVQREKDRAQVEEQRKARELWPSAFAKFQSEPNMLKRYGDVSEYIKKLSSPVRQAVGPDAILLACCILGGQLAKNDDNLRTIGLELKALVWNHLQDLQKIPLSSKINQFARKLSKGLGLLMDFPLCDDRILQTLHSEDVILAALSSLKVNRLMEPESKVEFQLRNCGPYMEKGFDSQPDPRVSNFNPDAWQREVLDVVDDRQSLFVVAPTSAGKTFISFYAMKQVLKESNDGVLVYVAPTKALCNQVAADIQARFNKGYPSMMVGKSVWAIHTRDYRVNTSTNCQVLVTVPQMLQNLLLSPTLSTGGGDNPWTSRIKWIVFDEVHSIGLSEEGVVWEQLLLIAPCPIIALSATVGNPNEFKDWMEGCEQRKGRELKMIIHPARYSDLRCYFWTPQEDFSFTGVAQTNRWPIPGLGPDGYNQDAPFTAIHPVAALLDRSRDSLDDISLESRNCLSLWQSMKRHQSAKYGLDLTLDPDRFFSKPATLKSRAVEWETELKKVMLHWMHNHDSPFLDVQKDFSSALEDNAPTRRYGIERILQLLVDLQKRDALPALIFLYDRTGCKDTVRKIVEQLRKSEVQWKETSPEWQRTLASFKKHQQEIKHLQKKAGKAPKKAKRAKNDGDDDYGPSSKLDALREDASQEGGKWAGFDPENPLEKFSLANYKKLAKSELEEIIKEIKYARLDDYIIEGLRRGVAVHHSGMNRGYLQIVEILFRKGFLSAVIATGTLALGINMPCKTVVFLGDSTFLTALNFRQGAGRAGRRGFDILGNIVFYDFTPHRAKEIMSLRLSDLRGHFPISTSLVLRTATLLHQTDRCEFSQQCLKSLFSQTRIYLGGPEGKDAIKHHLRFSIEYLRRHNLLSANGAPINFAGLISHLHYSEDSVFALHSLLEAGYFHKLCADIHRDEAGVLNNMVLVLSHLFGRIYCRRCKDKEWLENKVRPSSSVVLLPPLPAEAETILRKHNSETLSVFRSYVQTYVQQHLAGQPDDTLPFTHQKIASKNPSDTRSSQSAAELRSPFAALSGHTDKFYSIRELCSTVRAGVFLEESTVPYIGIYPVDTDGMPFNAYIYDFFRHGELKTLVTVNGIKDGDAWYLLQDFSLVLKTIVASIAKFISPSSGAGNELELIDLYDGQDGFEDDEGGVYSPEAIPGPALSEPTATEAEASITKAKAKSKKPKKVEVFDSWEDDKSESDEGEDEKNNEIVTSPGRSIVSLPLRPPAAGGSSAATASSPEQGLKTVLLAFERLHEQFEKKFKRVWA